MGLFSAPKTTTTQTTKLPKYLNDITTRLATRGETTSLKPFEAFSGDRIAGLSDDTMAGGDFIRKLMGQGNTRVIDNIPGATGGAEGSVQDYMNPYLQQILEPMLRQMGEKEGMDRNRLNAEATMAGAFGDSSHGIEASTLRLDSGRERSDMINRVLAQAFDSAMGLREADINRGNQTNQTNLQNLLGFGNMQDVKAQQGADFDFEEFMRQLGGDKESMTWLAQLLSGAPHESTTTGTSKSKGGEGTALIGGLASLASAFL
jgi:hypothetical protein